MFNLPPDKQRNPGFHADSYGFNGQPWSRFDFGQATMSSSSGFSAEQAHDERQDFGGMGGMEWAPTPSSVQPDYYQGHQQHPGDTDMELEALSSPHSGGGVGRLVAHFENKGFNPFENRSLASAPPLPPRPLNATVSMNNHTDGNDQRHHHHQQQQQQQHAAQSPSISMNSFQASLSFDPLSSYCGNGVSGGGGGSSPSFDSNRIASPVTASGESWGGPFPSSHRVTSPAAMSPTCMAFGSYHDGRVASPGAGPSPAPFGSLDGFMPGNRMRSPVAHQPDMASSPLVPSPVTPNSAAHQNTPAIGGTPGFEIWRPPGSADTKSLNRNLSNALGSSANPSIAGFRSSSSRRGTSSNGAIPNHATTSPAASNNNHVSATNSAGFLKPPVPTTPKPHISVGNQFILELNPITKAKSRASTKPPRPRVPPPIPLPFVPEIKQEPETPRPLEMTPSCPAEETRKQHKLTRFKRPKMYKTRFSQWGFVKNNTEEEVKRLLSMKFQRDAEGKVSEFVRNGRVVNLGTYLKRKGVTEYDLVDFELPADLPAHVRCRTPTPPPAPGYLRSPDLLRAQELVVSNMRKAFLHCRQFEDETEARIGWPVTMVWGAGSSELLLEANFYFEAQDATQGGNLLIHAFQQLEVDLKKLTPLGINELLLGMVHRDPGMMTALCKYLAAYSTTNFERSHPLRQIFTCLYEIQQKHGSMTVSELLWGSMPAIAEELETIYQRHHPYVARTWIDLALFYNHVNVEQFDKLVSELRLQQHQVEQRYGLSSADALALRYAILQSLYAANPRSEAVRQAAHDTWNHMRRANVVFGLRDAKANVYCYHCPVKVDPWTKRCRRRYDSGVAILEQHVGVKIQPYFEEDFHHAVHVPDAQEAWSSALDHMGSGKYAFI
ncbi:hypothetical protein UVI_02014880 [Ustilaginoidea virens]|uniref:Clr5 domain-containing protein n=1 Tax=Ustilaginoidea virens TaxID=1159556 RepID=A0A1B5L5X9_USTVR|nr:hypothetical protein UVI_02014880 [Ustilaginoidea virens]